MRQPFFEVAPLPPNRLTVPWASLPKFDATGYRLRFPSVKLPWSDEERKAVQEWLDSLARNRLHGAGHVHVRDTLQVYA